MAASLGESYERFSVRLPHSDGKKSQYLDEYMEVGKKDPKTGELTRFIFSKEEEFGLEITLNAGFNHGYYDGVMVKLSDVNSGDLIWQKKYPKSNAKEPSQQDQKILIDSIDHAIIDGKLRSKVLMKLAPLVPEDDFIKSEANETHRYPHMLEGVCIGICKYKGAGDIPLTKEEFDLKFKEHTLQLESYARTDGNGSLDTLKRTLVHREVYQKHKITHNLRLVDGVAVPNEDIEAYLTRPTNTKKLFRYSDTQNFYYLWRGEKFFDTTAIAQTPIALIRQPWDFLTPREREKAYGELSKHDFQQIWSHQFKALGPKPNKVATDALKNQLRENLPDYWRSWHKLYSYETSRAFKMLQERRRFLDRGDMPEDSGLIGKSEEAPIKLESAPKRLEKSSEKICIRSLTHPGPSTFSESTASLPKLAIAPMYQPEIPAQPKPTQTVAGMDSAVKRSAKTDPPGVSILGRVSASITDVLGPVNERVLCVECGKDFVSDRAFLDHFQPTHGHNFGDLNRTMMNKISPGAFLNSLPRAWANTRATEPMYTTGSRLTITSSSEVPAKSLNTSLSMNSHTEHRNNDKVAKLATKKSSNSKSSSTRSSVPKSSTKTISKALKRPAGVADLSRLKRPSSKRKRMMGCVKSEVAMHHSPVAVEQSTRPSVLSPACVESSVSEKENPTDPLDLGNSRMIVAADSSNPDAGSTSSFITTTVSSSLGSASVSLSSSVKPEASRIESSYPAEALPVLSPPVNFESSSIDTPSTSSSTITYSNSHVIPVLETSIIKSSETKSSSTINEVYTSAELWAATQLFINTPSKIEPSTEQAANVPSIIAEATASSVIPVIDLDRWVSSPNFIATYSSTSSSIPVIKSETDTDKKPQLKVDEDVKISQADIKSCEEEERRRETELEDAMRIAEARMELHRVRRKIETLRSGSL
ncbi:hypothetical protein EAE99_003433 [Botrytis elliptica]|nr:hypothetical protein EAE99_003433 [Botrytis elliptica]